MANNNFSAFHSDKNYVLTNDCIDIKLLNHLLKADFSLITPILSPEMNKELIASIITSSDDELDILQSLKINNSINKYENTAYLEKIANRMRLSDSLNVSILTSKYCRILPIDFQKRSAYVLLIEKDTEDYQYEYVEYILKKLVTNGFSIATPLGLKTSSDIFSAMQMNITIRFAAVHTSLSQENVRKTKSIIKAVFAESQA